MIYKYNKSLVSSAKALRRNMTKEEKHLWYDFLKKLPITVNRQKNIGNYIVDFFIASKRIVIELDGVQHLSREHKEEDEKRDSNLSLWGIKVLRYSNDAVRNQFRFVVEDILENLGLDYSCLSSFKTKM